ncbi:MAG: VWA domain-containing protein [Bacteroidota bacterium]|mgnify:FL=1|nr:VWA domain-containing protein [Bacteroidota bacterium]
MKGVIFKKYIGLIKDLNAKNFEDLLKIYQQLLLITSGDFNKTISIMTELDRKHNFTPENYGIGDFIEDLKKKGYIKENSNDQKIKITKKSELELRHSALDEIFGKLKKDKTGSHMTNTFGSSLDFDSSTKPYEFGDNLENIAFNESIKNAQKNYGIENFKLAETDLETYESDQKSQTSTVLLIDISHSMILYGEDRITPAKKVAMALSEMIMRKYKKDTLDVVVFGNDAWEVKIKDIPYLSVGPYHTNTIAGLELAMDLLRRRKNKNKQIFMITDGKPTCMKVGINYYKNAFGLDPKILNKTYNLAAVCKKNGVRINTFMIASDPYLMEFVEKFTEINDGSAYFADLQNLGSMIFKDYNRNKVKRY